MNIKMNKQSTKIFKNLTLISIIVIILFTIFIIPIENIIKLQTNSDNSQIHILDDTSPPIISFLQHHPSNPEWFNDINITVEVYDDNSGVKQVILSYSSNLDEYGGYRNFTMTQLHDDIYNYTIPNSIYVSNNGFGDTVVYKIYTCDQAGNWAVSPEQSYYMNDTILPNLFINSPANNSFISSILEFNISSNDTGSGVDCINITIYNQTGYKVNSFQSNEESAIFTWDTSSLPNYNSSNPLYYTAKCFVKDKATPQNINQTQLILYIDKDPPFVSYINRLPCQDNLTITNQLLKGLIIQNSSIKDTYYNDTKYLSILNSTDGTILMPLSINLSNFGINYDLIEMINITISAKISYSNHSIKNAGWGIYNWTNHTIYTIDDTIFNNSEYQTSSFLLQKSNISGFISNGNNSRIELFLTLNTTGQNITFSINYLNFHIIYDPTHWFYGNNFTISIWGNDSISIEKMVVHYENITLFEINSSYIGPCTIDTSKVPDGTSVNINLTTYDKAGNQLVDTIIIKNDHSGPNVSIDSPQQNSTFGQSGIWNTIVPITITGNEEYSEFLKMELYVDGQIQSVKDGQLGQIIETNSTGYIIYKQTNSTWYKSGTYTFYWNASLIHENQTVNITLIGYDILNNTKSFQLNITKCIFIENISIEPSFPSYLIENNPFILTVSMKNYGNSTLYNYTPTLILPSNWKYSLYQYIPSNFQFLIPGDEKTISFLITPSSVSNTKQFNLTFYINCQIIENLTQPINNFTTSLIIEITINEAPGYYNFQYLIPLIISICAGLGIGLFIPYLYYRSKIKGPQYK
ncbi:MAG: hypothetical protein ACTSPY_05590 [Candidatus Helarchaeota archaeon]